VERLFLTALMTWALCFSGSNCGAAKVQGPQTREMKTEAEEAAVVLTNEQPSKNLPLESSVPSSDAEVLEVSITKVENPSRAAITVFVYFSRTGKTTSSVERIELGNFSLYPADRPGKFLINAAPAARQLAAKTKGDKDDFQLVFEMKRVDESKPWTPVKVTISQPKWRALEK